MSAWLLAGYLNADALQATVQKLVRAGATVMLEGLTTLHMWRIEVLEAEWAKEYDPAMQEEGWMFDADFELRWQRLRGYPSHLPSFRVSLITDDAGLLARLATMPWQSTAGTPAQAHDLSLAGSGAFYLWGEAMRDSPGRDSESQTGWYEKEVPRIFYYPTMADNGARHVKVITKTYMLSLTHAADPDNSTDDVESGDEPALLHRFATLVPTEE